MPSTRKYNVNIVSAGALSGNLNSTAVRLQSKCHGFNIQAVISASSGPVVGVCKLQASNDDVPAASATNWTDIAGSSQAVNGNGSLMWDYAGSSFGHVRLVYTSTSGSGTLNAQMIYVLDI